MPIHGFRAGNQLRQEIFSLIEKLSYLIDGRDQAVIQQFLSRKPCIQRPAGNLPDAAPVSFKNCVIDIGGGGSFCGLRRFCFL